LTGVAPAGPKCDGGEHVGHKAQPIQIVEDRALVLRPAALAIVILDAQQHPRPLLAREFPDVLGVENVTEVKIAGWGRGEAGEGGHEGKRGNWITG